MTTWDAWKKTDLQNRQSLPLQKDTDILMQSTDIQKEKGEKLYNIYSEVAYNLE